MSMRKFMKVNCPRNQLLAHSEVQAATFRLVIRRVCRNSTNRSDGETHRNEAGPVPTRAMTWLWSLLTLALGFFTQQRIRAGDERQHESRITGTQMVVDHQDNF